MKTQVEVFPYELPFAIPYRWAKGVQHARRGLVIRMALGDAVGWGEATLPPHVEVDSVWHAKWSRAFVEGWDPAREDFLEWLDDREIPAHLRCGLSSAWFSAKAAASGLSLSAYLAGSDRSVAEKVPINLLITDKDPFNCAKQALRAQQLGYQTVKVKCTHERKLDLDRAAAIRAVCPDISIRLDPNGSWEPAWAMEHLEAMACFGIEYVEEPLPSGTSLAVYRDLRTASPIPVALDDSVVSAAQAESIIERQAADVLILKAQRVGGPDKLLAIADQASQAGLRSVITSNIETSIGIHLALHCAALLPEPIAACGLGTSHFFAADLAVPPAVAAGHMTVPSVPGLGVKPIQEGEG